MRRREKVSRYQNGGYRLTLTKSSLVVETEIVRDWKIDSDTDVPDSEDICRAMIEFMNPEPEIRVPILCQACIREFGSDGSHHNFIAGWGEGALVIECPSHGVVSRVKLDRAK